MFQKTCCFSSILTAAACMPYMTDIEDIEVFWVHAVPNSRGNIVEDYMGRMLGHVLWVFLGPLCKLSCTLVSVG